MIIWYSGAIITGSILGICFYYIFRKIVPHGFTIRYFASLGQNIHGLLKDDVSLFWKFYRHTWPNTPYNRHDGHRVLAAIALE
jgi:hypothetical protein